MVLRVAGAFPGRERRRVIMKFVPHNGVELAQRIQAALKRRVNGRRRHDVRLRVVVLAAER